LSIRDNGRGFDAPGIANGNNAGAGLKNMQKRTNMIDGKFSLESETGRGTQIVILITVPETIEIDNDHKSMNH
jgi:signal transduction histidine kinase